MKLFLAGNFVIMGEKEKEKAFQTALGKECCRLGSFFYKKEMDIVTELKGEENENKEKINKKSPTNSKRIIKRRTAKIIRKKRRT